MACSMWSRGSWLGGSLVSAQGCVASLTRRCGNVMFVFVCSLLSCFLPYQYLSWYNVITSPPSVVSGLDLRSLSRWRLLVCINYVIYRFYATCSWTCGTTWRKPRGVGRKSGSIKKANEPSPYDLFSLIGTINYDKFASRVLYHLLAHYVPEATLQQNVQDRDFPSRRVRKKPPQADIDEFKAA